MDHGKTNCLVLDFIGNQRREFRFDLRFRALFGGTRQQVVAQLETGVTRLPGSCYFRLDHESRQVILRNLKAQLTANRLRMVQELQALAQLSGRVPTMEEYLRETQYDLQDLYKDSVGGWTRLLHDSGLGKAPVPEEALALTKRFRFLLHLDCVQRMQLFETCASDDSIDLTGLGVADQRAIEMLTYRVLQTETRMAECTWQTVIQRLRAYEAAREEFLQLLAVLRSSVRVHRDEQPFREGWPLVLHRSYTRDEILFATGFRTIDKPRECREGRLFLSEHNTEIFFVTLEKTEKHFSPTTRYEDYAISPRRFHWQSQSTTSAESVTGRRYIEQSTNGMDFLLFVRPTKHDAFVFLGPLRYRTHTGSRPVSITWDLLTPMPAWFFELCAALRAA